MKITVIYKSGTGFTAKYAEWIAEELGCDVKELRKTNINQLKEYDLVIYGGWIFAGMVSGYSKIKNMRPGNLVVFGVGMTPAGQDNTSRIIEQNGLDPEKFFYFEGGYRPEKVGFIKRKMMNIIKKSIQNKEEKTKEDLYMLEKFEGAENTDKEAIRPLINYAKGVQK